MKPCIICHYDEIGLKGKNRNFFEQGLIDNLKRKIKAKELHGRIQLIFGRLKIELENFPTPEEKELWHEVLSTTFGLANFGFGIETRATEEDLIATTIEITKDAEFDTFRVTASRSDKQFPMTSPEINHLLGGTILKNMEDKKVKLKNPEANLFVEIFGKTSYLYVNKHQGAGGLPVGCSGKSMVLLSGGIDSPVAAFYAQKRGLSTIFIHFHSYPQTSMASVEKVRELAQKLTKFTPQLKLYMCPFLDIQKEILKKAPDKFRILLYRRFMMRITNKIAHSLKAKCIITGEALGQVASQTIENITTVEQSSDLPVLRPLIGFDKQEIITKAKAIDTFQISIKPHDDCCTVYMPKQPETKSKLDEILEVEKNFDIDTMVEKAIENIEIESFHLK